MQSNPHIHSLAHTYTETQPQIQNELAASWRFLILMLTTQTPCYPPLARLHSPGISSSSRHFTMENDLSSFLMQQQHFNLFAKFSWELNFLEFTKGGKKWNKVIFSHSRVYRCVSVSVAECVCVCKFAIVVDDDVFTMILWHLPLLFLHPILKCVNIILWFMCDDFVE